MKKLGLCLFGIMLVTGCGTKKDTFFSSWTTSYEIPAFGIITEQYDFKEDGTCVRILKTSSDIVENCTYEWNEDKTKIRIVWDSKLDKDAFYNYSKTSDNEIVIGARTFTKQS